MDIVFIHGLEVHPVIGVWEWEKHNPRRLVIDLDLGHDNRKPAKSDELELTINYQKISETLVDFCKQQRIQLIETLAESIAQILIDDFNIAWCRVKISKPGAVKQARQVGVIIERHGKNALK